MSAWPHRHLLGIGPLSREDILQVLDLSDSLLEILGRPIKKVPTLRGRTVATLFLEASTRTRASFEAAAKMLSADVVNLGGDSSSVAKGETLLDTARTLESMAFDVLVVRHAFAGAPHWLARNLAAAVINAGDGTNEHPTQALLDAATLRARKGRIEGLTVAICGDIAHSRVARSDLLCLLKLGATVRLAGPPTLALRGAELLGARVHDRIEPALEGADAVIVLRVQAERISGPRMPGTREYARFFSLSRRRLELARPDAVLMHPGPVIRGVEIDPDLADSPQSAIRDQVTRGVAVRMALLYLMAGAAA